jgi:hypothetical protein
MMSQSEQVLVHCRLPNVSAGSNAGFDFCVFEFPGCGGCPSVSVPVRTFVSVEDPMRSKLLSGWLFGNLHALA